MASKSTATLRLVVIFTLILAFQAAGPIESSEEASPGSWVPSAFDDTTTALEFGDLLGLNKEPAITTEKSPGNHDPRGCGLERGFGPFNQTEEAPNHGSGSCQTGPGAC